jgi:hypothetical protein
VLARESDAVALSHDHKPNRLDEYQRVKDLGGFVEWRGVWRVQVGRVGPSAERDVLQLNRLNVQCLIYGWILSAAL